MRLCRFNDNRLGVVTEAGVHDVTEALKVLPAHTYPLPNFDPLIANLAALRRAADELMPRAPVIALDQVRLLSPIANPGK
jgi:hypothetical protein